MRNLKKIILLAVALLFIFVISCSKDDAPSSTTGDLFNKPLPVIKASIQGKWQLHYGKGGFIANLIHDWGNDDYWEFDFKNSENRIKTYREPLEADTKISWIKGQDNYAGETYIMEFYDKEGSPCHLVVDGIYNDTLTIHFNSPDAMFLYFTKP
ncbi:MAG TPA: hypothetical protein PLD18_05275 [Flavobacterium sp.]|nr:hypothetical protein [Flavobacterium sp.]HRA73158.1 hypothetical protein [Flavobacterium sp.]